MTQPRTLAAFSAQESIRVHELLASRVAYMMGRKLEEGDWISVYCAAKGLPDKGWSNLNIDVMSNGLGVEHKMLRQSSERSLKAVCGTTLMHPAATRSIRVGDGDANEVMRDVLQQYADLIDMRREKVRETNPDVEPDMRTGWLLWQSSLREFMYFEEEMLPPDPRDYYAEWKESGGGSRKSSKNLWVYEKETGQKRYSITTAAGAKIQPYFDVPPPNDPNLYFFQVQGEEINMGLIRVWIAEATERELRRLVGDVSVDHISQIILDTLTNQIGKSSLQFGQQPTAVPVILTSQAYYHLQTTFQAVSDEHLVQQLILVLNG
jgi:hypothetical protein